MTSARRATMVALAVLVTIATKANWNQVVGWSPVASPEEAAQASREGGWWGDEVPVWPIR